jgi:hypothetical protein
VIRPGGPRSCPAASSATFDRIGAARISAKEVAAVIVALAFAAIALRAWNTGQSSYHAVQVGAPSETQRELGPLVDQSLAKPLLAARRVIPREDTFAVRVGLSPPVDGYILQAVPLLFQYWLLPRRYTNDSHAADWVITFNHPAGTLGVVIRRVVKLSRSVSAVEVQH